jgi:DNA polymerase-3 subunit chi
VAFHTGVVDAVGHTLRLIRKAISLGSRVLVIGTDEAVRELDEQLWTVEPGSFFPHVMWSEQIATSTRVLRAPVWLLRAASAEREVHGPLPTGPDVMINLGLAVPREAGQFLKVFEVVSAQATERAIGQQRWRAWRERGISPAHHAFS